MATEPFDEGLRDELFGRRRHRRWAPRFRSDADHRSRHLGPPPDRAEALALLRRAVELFADTDQVALAWLLAISPVTPPIPGTATRAHLEANVTAAALRLDQDEIDAISAAVAR